jgi:hypothetical protein
MCVFLGFYRLTTTKLRHLAVTIFSAILPEETRDLASLMTHSVATQQKKYNESQTTAKNVRVANLLSKILQGKVLTGDDFTPQDYGLH